MFLLHVEATDEAGHAGDLDEKVQALEAWDSRILAGLVEGLDALGPWRMLLLPDHPTPVALRTHTATRCPTCWSTASRTGRAASTASRPRPDCEPVPGHELLPACFRLRAGAWPSPPGACFEPVARDAALQYGCSAGGYRCIRADDQAAPVLPSAAERSPEFGPSPSTSPDRPPIGRRRRPQVSPASPSEVTAPDERGVHHPRTVRSRAQGPRGADDHRPGTRGQAALAPARPRSCSSSSS